MLDGLNKEQLAAVRAPIAPVIVMAGPGSGKTRVLTCRIGHMVESLGYDIAPHILYLNLYISSRRH